MSSAARPPLIADTDSLAAVCKRLRGADFVAVDTEFMRESTYWPQLCLVQMAGGDDEVLIDPLAPGLDLAPWLELMRAPTLKVFHAARQDAEIVHNLCGAPPEPMFDTQVAASAVGLGDSVAYDNLVRALLKRNVDKSSRFTDWSRRPLSDAQLVYALSDVTHLRDLYPKLEAMLSQKGRLDWVRDEMAVLVDPATYDLNPDDAWKRLKLRKTTPAFVAALKAVAAWREREARARDVPRGRVMKDEVIYEVALSRPTDADALGKIRGVPKGFERSRAGAELIAALAPAIADPAAHAPAFERESPPPMNTGATVELLKVLLKHAAEAHNVAPRLIATIADLEKIAADDDADVPALQAWRREVFGEAALKLKRGEVALKLVGDRVKVIALPQER